MERKVQDILRPHARKIAERLPDMLSQVLKEYRTRYNITQEQLANNLNVDVRTLRRWENQETILKDKEELRRLASKLGVEAYRLGLTSESITDQQASETLEHIWSLIDASSAWEARLIAERLVGDLQAKAHGTGKKEDIYKLTLAHHAAACTKAMSTRVSEIRFPLNSYQYMEATARAIGDSRMVAIALTYQGDMYTRTGKLDKALPLLNAAIDTVPDEDIAVRGNALQLLGRAHLKADNKVEFERALKESEDLSSILTGNEITRGQYCLTSVYEEYGRGYALIGENKKALDYLEKAYQIGAPALNWDMVLKTAKVMVLVRAGEIEVGTSLALECIEACRKYGRLRLLERIYGVQNYLQRMRKQIGRSVDVLDDALNGPGEY